MKNLHEIPREKQEFDWKKLKFPEWTTHWQELNTSTRLATEAFNTFRNYYINYPASGVINTGSMYIDGQYVGEGTGQFTIPDNEWHHLQIRYQQSYSNAVLNDNPVQYWRLGEVASGAV